MKIYVVKRSFFTFRGKESYELELLGKSVLSLMCERLGAELCEESELPKGEKAVLYPVYPLLKMQDLAELFKIRGSFMFSGGYIDRGGEMSVSTRRLHGGLFTLADYPALCAQAAKERAEECMKAGALVEEGAQIDFTAVIKRGAIIRGGTRVRGNSVVHENAEIAGGEIFDSEVGENTVVRQSYLEGVRVGKDCTVGPFAYLRGGSRVGDNCRIGDFVELKNAKLGNGCKAAHLSYVGDAELGEWVNVGCGVVFANYNGKTKSKTVVGKGCFLGSNSNLIAPVTVADGAYIAAGTTLTQNLNEHDFCIGRCRETIKPNRAPKYLNKK